MTTDKQPNDYSDYYTFCMSDGWWWIAPMTQHQWNGKPDLPREYDRGYSSKAAADAALKQARAALTQSEGAR